MKLKAIFPAIIACMGVAGVLSSCEDMLDTDSNSFVFDKDHNLNSANDSLYSAMGILTQLQKIGERYAVLGELRGDLVSVPADAPIDYQNVSNFSAMADADAFGSRRDYYSIINNCNVALTRMDTQINEHGVLVMMPEYAAIRTLRDWTFLQIALTYGSAHFTNDPVLSVEEAEQNVPAVALDALVPRLIADLEPLADIKTPNYGTVDGQASTNFFIRPALLLADLYLYNGQYEQAAAMYYKVIDEAGYTISMDHANTWKTSVRAECTPNNRNTYTNEAVSFIPYASDPRNYHPNMVNLTYNSKPVMVPADWFVTDMNLVQHFHVDRLGVTNISGYLEGDTRGMFINREDVVTPSAMGYAPAVSGVTRCLITKWLFNGNNNSSVINPNNPLFQTSNLMEGMEEGTMMTRFVALYRIPQIYLRYAEAVNRTGRPTLAFAAMKYGLRAEVLADPDKVDPEELADNLPWTNFSDQKYNSNYGTAMRGRGIGISIENSVFVIPENATKEEAIAWVEERLLDEMASETAFEGHRFFDLLRISHHRGDHPALFADKVSRRFDNAADVRNRLSDVNNLWVK